MDARAVSEDMLGGIVLQGELRWKILDHSVLMEKILIFCEFLPGAFFSSVGKEAKGHRGREFRLSLPLDLLSQRPKEGACGPPPFGNLPGLFWGRKVPPTAYIVTPWGVVVLRITGWGFAPMRVGGRPPLLIGLHQLQNGDGEGGAVYIVNQSAGGVFAGVGEGVGD